MRLNGLPRKRTALRLQLYFERRPVAGQLDAAPDSNSAEASLRRLRIQGLAAVVDACTGGRFGRSAARAYAPGSQ